MKKLILFLSFLTFSVLVFSQTKSQTESVKSAVSNVLKDPALSAPYQTTVNHDGYKNEIMKVFVQEDYQTILDICKTKGFSKFMVVKDKSYIFPASESEILTSIKEFKKSLPDNISQTADSIVEETLLGDNSRSETWNYTNKKGQKVRMTVMFINGQITNILVTI